MEKRRKPVKILGVFIGDDGKKREVDLKELPHRDNKFRADQEAREEGREHRRRIREAFEAGDGRKMRLMQSRVVVKKK